MTGQIEGTVVSAGSRVGGRVSEVLVKEGDRVTRGDVVIRLEAREADAAVAAAAAAVAQAEAVLAKLEAGARPEELRRAEAAVAQAEESYRMALEGARSQEIQTARANVQTARAQRDQARVEFERLERLYEGGAISKQRLDQVSHALEGAQGQYQAALEQLNLLVAGTREEQIAIAKARLDEAEAFLDELRTGARIEDIAAARAARDAAKAELTRAEVTLDEMTVRSPLDGVVEVLDVHPGDIVRPGPVVKIADPEDLELVVYVSSVMLGHLRVGQDVPVTTDSHGDRRFTGRLSQIATVGEFTPRNLQTEEERAKQVFGVTLQLDSADGALRAGMAATAHIELTP